MVDRNVPTVNQYWVRTVNREPPAREPKNTDDELLEAVAHQCNTRAPPVVKTEHVAETETVEVTQQTVKRRLDKLRDEGKVGGLQIGRGWVWWIPENEGELEFDSSTIYWDGIEPEQIPDELVEQHPEYPNPGRWEKLRNQGETVANTAVYPFFFGLMVMLIAEFGLDYIPLPGQTQSIGAISFIGGIAFLAFGILLIVVANLGDKLEQSIGERLNDTRFKEAIQ
jgi:hypothetical protein